MTIKDVCKELGITSDALKHYEREGLLSPKRGSNKYRIYDEQDIIRIRQIQCFRQLNMSVKEIKDYFNLDNGYKRNAIEEQLKILKEQRDHIDNMIATLEIMRFTNAKYIPIDSHFNVDVAGPYFKDALSYLDGGLFRKSMKEKYNDFEDHIRLLFERIPNLGIVEAHDNELQSIIHELDMCISENTGLGVLVLIGILGFEEYQFESDVEIEQLIGTNDYKTLKQGVEYYLEKLAEDVFMPVFDSAYEQYCNNEKIVMSMENYEKIMQVFNEGFRVIPIDKIIGFVEEVLQLAVSDDEINNDEDAKEFIAVVTGMMNAFTEIKEG